MLYKIHSCSSPPPLIDQIEKLIVKDHVLSSLCSQLLALCLSEKEENLQSKR